MFGLPSSFEWLEEQASRISLTKFLPPSKSIQCAKIHFFFFSALSWFLDYWSDPTRPSIKKNKKKMVSDWFILEPINCDTHCYCCSFKSCPKLDTKDSVCDKKNTDLMQLSIKYGRLFDFLNLIKYWQGHCYLILYLKCKNKSVVSVFLWDAEVDFIQMLYIANVSQDRRFEKYKLLL